VGAFIKILIHNIIGDTLEFTKGISIEKKELEKQLKRFGWLFKRQNKNCEIWTNGNDTIRVPRHNKVVEPTAKKILSNAKNHPG